MSPNTCIVIPIFNHKEAIINTIKALKKYKLFCFIIDDGSEIETKNTLKNIEKNEDWVECYHFTTNKGKGAAVKFGLSYAKKKGFTHAVQVDADGQHDLGSIKKMLEISSKNQNAFVLAQPKYDKSVPRSRLYARYITHFWVGIETLSFKVLDTMCGLRVYPLESITKITEKKRLGDRMDFDTEIVVRSVWKNIPVRTLHVKVHYPEDGISHFRVFHDNVLNSKMHTKLFLGMLIRFPLLLFKKIFYKNNVEPHWSEKKERGSSWAVKLIGFSYKVFGKTFCKLLLYPVITYFFLTGRKSRKASKLYLTRLYETEEGKKIFKKKPSAIDSYKHFLEFGRAIIEKISAWIGHIKIENTQFDNAEEFLNLLRTKKGGVVIGSHLGNLEVIRALSEQVDEIKMNVLALTKHAENFNSLLKKLNPNVDIKLIQISEMSIDTAILLKEKADNGEIIVIAGDRTSAVSQERISYVNFLGHPAPFAQGPFILAALLKTPVYLLFALREGKKYVCYFEKFSDKIDLPKKNKEQALKAEIEKFAVRLEHYCYKAPFQWYNFYNFWQDEKPKKEQNKA
ncbi:MAG: glycosyltransferase family 2 protein [Spirochaetia bacterium]|nr:glycosyltransferase family 2 protein [Spirochaetia bacterium]